MNLHAKASFEAVEGGPGTLTNWDLANHNLGCLAEWENPCILHVITSKTGTVYPLKCRIRTHEHSLVRYCTVWYNMVRYGTVQHGTVQYGMSQYGQYATAWHITAWHITAWHWKVTVRTDTGQKGWASSTVTADQDYIVLWIRDVYPGSWFFSISDLGSRISDPGSRILDPGSRFSDPGTNNKKKKRRGRKNLLERVQIKISQSTKQ